MDGRLEKINIIQLPISLPKSKYQYNLDISIYFTSKATDFFILQLYQLNNFSQTWVEYVFSTCLKIWILDT